MNPELAQFEQLAKEILRRCIADEDPGEIRQWLADTMTRLGGGDDGAILTWPESFDLVDSIIDEYERIASTPESERKVLTWPWASWNRIVDPLDKGMLGVISAPDGAGKTVYAESIAEHWAQHKNRIAFVHFELNRTLMMLRRTARHASLTIREIKSGRLTTAQKAKITALRPQMTAWDGYISYVHTPGWNMERTIAQLTQLHADGNCDAVMVDYLEKAGASQRQLRMFGSNSNQREADNVEQLKNFAESTGIPVVMLTQFSKAGKGESFGSMDRNSMRGAGEKSEKANLVVLLHREREGDGYSNTVTGLIDKNTMGATGAFRQIMQPEFFRVGDPA